MGDGRVDEFVAALLARDVVTATELVARMREDGTSVESIYVELFAPGLRRIGELWANEQISVAAEHLASAVVQQLMGALHGQLFIAPRASRERVVVAAPAGERHEIGLRMVADLLEGHGFDVLFLGADLPREEFSHLLERYNPHVIVLAAYSADTVDELVKVGRELLARAPRLSIITGGASDAIRKSLGSEVGVQALENIGDARPAVEQAVAGRQTQ